MRDDESHEADDAGDGDARSGEYRGEDKEETRHPGSIHAEMPGFCLAEAKGIELGREEVADGEAEEREEAHGGDERELGLRERAHHPEDDLPELLYPRDGHQEHNHRGGDEAHHDADEEHAGDGEIASLEAESVDEEDGGEGADEARHGKRKE